MVDAHNLARRGRGSTRFIVSLRWALAFAAPFMFGLSSFSAYSLSWLVLLLFVASNLCLHWLDRSQGLGRHRWIWYATVACDLALVTLVVITRGGIRTDAYLLYVLIVTEAGILLRRREAWAAGVIALCAYIGTVLWTNGPGDLGRVIIRTVYLGLVALATSYLAASEQKALTAALTDVKTNLPNARMFQEALREAVALHSRMGRPLAVAILDVDNFRQLNTHIGHPLADQVLERLAEVLMRWKRSDDVIARYGGEEFVILLPDVDLAAARERLEQLREQVAATSFAVAGHPPVRVTISCGVSSMQVAPTASALLLTADEALMAAKAGGKNCVVSS